MKRRCKTLPKHVREVRAVLERLGATAIEVWAHGLLRQHGFAVAA